MRRLTARTGAEHPVLRRTLLGSLFLAITLLMMRGSWHTLTTKVPNLGDPVLYDWTWNFTREQIVRSPLHLFDGNIFWPHELTVAYTDNMLVLLGPFALLRALGAGWAAQINALSIAMLTGSVAATYALARRLCGRTDAAIFAAISYTFGSYTFSHLGHVQLLLIGQFPLALLLAFRFFERRRVSDAIWFGLVNASFFLGALYYAAIWMVCCTVVVVGYVVARRFRPGPRFWSGLAIVALASATAIPFVLPYAQLDQERPLVPEWGFKYRDVITVAPGSTLYSGLDTMQRDWLARGEQSFFAGFSAQLLALVGAGALGAATWRARRRRPDDEDTSEPPAVRADPLVDPDRRRELWLVAWSGLAALIVALGPEVHGHTMPFTYLHDHVPGFQGIRVAARLAVPALLTLAVLAAVGIAYAVRRVPRRAQPVVVVALTGLLLLELAAPVWRTTLPDDRATLAVYRALQHRPEGVVAELPISDPVDAFEWAYVEAPRMVYGTLDMMPRINGYSGSFPSGYPEAITVLNRFPRPAAMRAARRAGVRYVVLHVGPFAGFEQYTPARARAIVAALPAGTRAAHFGNAWLVDLGPAPPGTGVDG